MYLTSFVHCNKLLEIAERWFWGRPEPDDALKLTKILISDVYIVGETLDRLMDYLLAIVDSLPCTKRRIRWKGELRDAICRSDPGNSQRVGLLCQSYLKDPEYFFLQAPINGVMCTDGSGRLRGLYRIKRPRRIAEKANRRIARWILGTVREEARMMAEIRAMISGVPLDELMTPEPEMVREFREAEQKIAENFRRGTIRLDRDAITINDVGGMKLVADREELDRLEKTLREDKTMRVFGREDFHGDYEATSLILEVPWDAERACRRFRESRRWERYCGRGIPEAELKKGLEPLLEGGEPLIRIELILSTYDALVESELGSSIHEERIIAQRDDKVYKGYIPTNVEFLLEYLFAVGFSPATRIDSLPVKLWGRYLPDTLIMYIRRLYELPELDFF